MNLYIKQFEKPDDGGPTAEAPDGGKKFYETAKFPPIKKPPEIARYREGEPLIEEASSARKKDRSNKAKKGEVGKLRKGWRKVSPAVAAVAALVITVIAVIFAGKFLINKFFHPIDPADPTPIVVEIPKGSGASAIAKILYEAGGEGEKGLIENKAMFKMYVDFLGRSSSLKAGTYVLSRNMDIGQIVDIICSGNPPRNTTKFTVSEGMTVESIAKKLVDQGILGSPDRFIELCTDAKAFSEKYWFIKNIVEEGRDGRIYMLEGYLFPDTYEVFEDATEEEVIEKMLDRFNDIYSRKYAEQAEEIGLTPDEVVILASMVEKEAKPFDFVKVSSVFHLRLEREMPLHSDATLGYVLKSNRMEFSQEELDTQSPYNTYLYSGLPAGPISNPGMAAIEAVLYPDEEFMAEGYLFFCLTDPSTGALVFAKTVEEHAANVEKYRPLWGNN